MHSSFKELKNPHLTVRWLWKIFLKLSIYSYGYALFCLTNFNDLPLNSCDKYLKILSRANSLIASNNIWSAIL